MSTKTGRTTTRRAFCSAVSSTSAEPLAATASRVDHWILVEYRGTWASDPLDGSQLSPELKDHLRTQVAALPHPRLVFVKRPGRRAHGGGRVLFASSRPGEERLFELDVERMDDLLEVALDDGLAGTAPGVTPVEGPLWVVCTHGKRDRCCALHGRPLYDALRHETTPARVWQSTHLGGDRFAGNVVVLPHGLYYGRVRPDDVAGLVAAHEAGQIDLRRYRGRSAHSFAVQAAERSLRETEGLLGIGDVAVLGAVRGTEGDVRVRLGVPGGAEHELRVVASLADEPVYLTCDSAEPRRARRWRVASDDVVSR